MLHDLRFAARLLWQTEAWTAMVVVSLALGIGAGLAAALAAGRLVATLLFGVAPTDIVSMSVAVLVLAAVSVVAGYGPAQRASRVDPIVALHYE